MTLMVRQLSPTNIGLPLQIYAFTTTTAWEEYEGIQSDIMDHLLAMMPLFGLDVAQQDTASPMARRDRASLIDQWTGDGSGNE
jgi:miniconductance mechanosensitive channel